MSDINEVGRRSAPRPQYANLTSFSSVLLLDPETGLRPSFLTTLVTTAFVAVAGLWSAACAGPIDPLSSSDVSAYRAAFDAASKGDDAGARTAVESVRDDVLAPYIVRDLLMATNVAPPDNESFVGWLSRYGNYAGADRVFARAMQLRLPTAEVPQRPDVISVRRSTGWVREPSYRPVQGGPGLNTGVRARVDAAAARFYAGDDQTAFVMATSELTGPLAGQAGWISGLAAFRVGDMTSALASFETTSRWEYGDDWTRSAGAFWASRAAEKLGDQSRVRANLESAAASPLTFYGQLALARLGRTDSIRLPSADDTKEQAKRLAGQNAFAKRAAALVQVGRADDAELEFLRGWASGKADEDFAWLGLAESLHLPAARQRIAESGGPAALVARYPIPAWEPRNGWTIDRALVLAVMRQESAFNPRAVSRTGARGLMQLIPSTAAWMTGRPELKRSPEMLYNPEFNMELGQAYIKQMLNEGVVGGDVIRALMAYNAGPGALARWTPNVPGGQDPLMFLEASPNGQARVYAEKVMANMWVYHRRFGQRAPTLESLVAGRLPLYRAMDNPRMADATGPSLRLSQ